MQRWIETSDGIKFPVSDSHLRKIPWFKNMLDDTIDDGAPIQIQYSFEKFILAVGSTMYENWIDSEAKDYFLVEDPVTHLKNGTIISDPKTQRLYYDRNKDDTIKFDAMGRNVQEGLVLEAILDHNTEFLNIPYEGITRFQYFFKDRWNRNVYLFGDIDYLWLYYVYGYLSYGVKSIWCQIFSKKSSQAISKS